jgi:hypothetical protein
MDRTNRREADWLSLEAVGLLNGKFRFMASPALCMQEGFYTLVSQQGNKCFNTGRPVELIEFDPVDFLHPINGSGRFTRQGFNFRFSRNG